MSIPKVKPWRRIRDQLCAIACVDTVPAIPDSSESLWCRKRTWSRTIDWARQHGLLAVIRSLNGSDFRQTETFRSSAVFAENYSGDIGEKLAALKLEGGWTKRKRQLVDELICCLQQNGYLTVSGHGVRYRVSHVGGSFIYRVPLDQCGHLKPFRGVTVRVVCTGSGSRTDRTYMIGTAGVEGAQ